MAATSDLQLNSSMRCAKYMIFTFSFMFAITAVLLIIVGSLTLERFYNFRQFVDDNFLSAPALLIAIGLILLFVSMLGAYGGIKESVMLINLYGVFLFLVFILDVSASIAAFVMRGQIWEMLKATMDQSMADYDSNDVSQAGIDIMQIELKCCGIDGPEDWSKYLDPSIHNVNNGTVVPHSCCDGFFRANEYQECFDQYLEGCFSKMESFLNHNTMLIAVGATTVSFAQLMGSLCAFMLGKTLRRHKSMREVRRWQLQQSLDVLISGEKVAPPINNSFMASCAQFESDPMTYTPNSPSVIN